MKTSIQINFFYPKQNKKLLYTESNVPFVKVTRSKTGKTGTATFLFALPFCELIKGTRICEKVCLAWKDNSLATTNLSLNFYKGKPLLLKATFLFTRTTDWFDFLSFMNLYSRERGLIFQSDL